MGKKIWMCYRWNLHVPDHHGLRDAIKAHLKVFEQMSQRCPVESLSPNAEITCRQPAKLYACQVH